MSFCRVVAGAAGGCARCGAGVRPNEGRSDSVRLVGASTELLDEGAGGLSSALEVMARRRFISVEM